MNAIILETKVLNKQRLFVFLSSSVAKRFVLCNLCDYLYFNILEIAIVYVLEQLLPWDWHVNPFLFHCNHYYFALINSFQWLTKLSNWRIFFECLHEPSQPTSQPSTIKFIANCSFFRLHREHGLSPFVVHYRKSFSITVTHSQSESQDLISTKNCVIFMSLLDCQRTKFMIFFRLKVNNSTAFLPRNTIAVVTVVVVCIHSPHNSEPKYFD